MTALKRITTLLQSLFMDYARVPMATLRPCGRSLCHRLSYDAPLGLRQRAKNTLNRYEVRGYSPPFGGFRPHTGAERKPSATSARKMQMYSTRIYMSYLSYAGPHYLHVCPIISRTCPTCRTGRTGRTCRTGRTGDRSDLSDRSDNSPAPRLFPRNSVGRCQSGFSTRGKLFSSRICSISASRFSAVGLALRVSFS